MANPTHQYRGFKFRTSNIRKKNMVLLYYFLYFTIWYMPLTPTGKKVIRRMESSYGKVRGRSIFYASINKGTLKKSQMEGKKKK